LDECPHWLKISLRMRASSRVGYGIKGLLDWNQADEPEG